MDPSGRKLFSCSPASSPWQPVRKSVAEQPSTTNQVRANVCHGSHFLVFLLLPLLLAHLSKDVTLATFGVTKSNLNAFRDIFTATRSLKCNNNYSATKVKLAKNPQPNPSVDSHWIPFFVFLIPAGFERSESSVFRFLQESSPFDSFNIRILRQSRIHIAHTCLWCPSPVPQT